MESLIEFFSTIEFLRDPGVAWMRDMAFLPHLLGYAVVIAAVFAVFGVFAMFAVWMERKVSAHMQSRLGPMRTGGWHGWAQTLADGIKLMLKEDIRPAATNALLWIIAPGLVFCAALACFVALPISQGWVVSDLNLGVFYIVAIASIEVVGVIMAGWSSNNKWALLGAIREGAQVVSYEIPAAMTLMVPILVVGSFSLTDIVNAQGGGWFIWHSPWLFLAGIVYFLASIAACKRAPFDMPEAESELVAGFHTEYSGLAALRLLLHGGVRVHLRRFRGLRHLLPRRVAPAVRDARLQQHGHGLRGRGYLHRQDRIHGLHADVAALDPAAPSRRPGDEPGVQVPDALRLSRRGRGGHLRVRRLAVDPLRFLRRVKR